MRFQRVQRPTSQNSEASKSSSFTSCPANVQASEALDTFATQGKSDMGPQSGYCFANLPVHPWEDGRPQQKLKELVMNSPQARQAAALQEVANNSSQILRLANMQEMLDHSPHMVAERNQGTSTFAIPPQRLMREQEVPAQNRFNAEATPSQLKGEPAPLQNHTGLPPNLKAGIEKLSGMSMDDVHVHYNSPKPASLQSLAYTHGTEIHVGPSQERHLPHEAWHVVQQKQGRVKPTVQMKAGVPVNDDAALEREADVMGESALQRMENGEHRPILLSISSPIQRVVQLAKLVKDKLNVAGENHDESDKRRNKEREFARTETGSENYWQEGDFANGTSPKNRLIPISCVTSSYFRRVCPS
jgi:hypothetical protein